MIHDVRYSLEHLASLLEGIQRRQPKPSAKRDRRNFHLREVAIEIGELAPGVEYWIAESPLSEESREIKAKHEAGDIPESIYRALRITRSWDGVLNGYVAFPKRHAPLEQHTLGGILAYIPVHGGVTYVVKDQCACVYGFDTAHCDSEHVPRTDRQWIAWQCRVLYEGILKAATIEARYLRSHSNRERAELLAPLLGMIPEEHPGFEATVNMLTGEL